MFSLLVPLPLSLNFTKYSWMHYCTSNQVAASVLFVFGLSIQSIFLTSSFMLPFLLSFTIPVSLPTPNKFFSFLPVRCTFRAEARNISLVR